MTARDIIIPFNPDFSSNFADSSAAHRYMVDANEHIFEILPRLTDSPNLSLVVTDNGKAIGRINADAMVNGLANTIIGRDDCSIIIVECTPENFSASKIAHAIEDADAHLFDMISTPTDSGMVRITLRIGHIDPSAAIRSIERYEMTVVDAFASNFKSAEISSQRLHELSVYLNI